MLGSIIILMAAPCAINALITVRLYGLNINLSMAPFITTVRFVYSCFIPHILPSGYKWNFTI